MIRIKVSYLIIIIIKKKLVVEIKSLNSIGNKDKKVPFEIIVQNNSMQYYFETLWKYSDKDR